MNYRHAFHAGNFADVVKHLAEVAILQHLAKKDAPFAVIDSHAGRGRYDLASPEARKTGEAGAGIDKLRDLSGTPCGKRPCRRGRTVLHFARRRTNTPACLLRNTNVCIIVEDAGHKSGREAQTRCHVA